MSYSKKFKFFTVKQWIFVSIFIICVIVILYEVYLLYNNMTSEGAVNSTINLGNKSPSSTVDVLQAKRDMEQGELLNVSMVEMTEVPLELAPQGAVTSLSRLDNMMLKHKVAEKELLNDLDLMPEAASFENGDRLIEHNFDEGSVPAAVIPGSEIDIKLFVRGGKDPVVVAKTVVISRTANLLSFYMDSREQELIKEAAAEGMLFIVQYLDDSQNASEVTYVASYENGGYSNEK